MGRPQLAIGTHGKFRFYPEGDHWRVRCKVRDFDGTIREVQRVGRSKALAERSLSEALRDRARVDASAEVTPDTRLAIIAELWFSQFQEQDRSPTTLQAYRDKLNRQILPGLGNLRIREMTPGVVDRHLRAVATKHGTATAKMSRTVLSQILALAVRHDALDTNPTRDASPISTKPKKAPRAFTQAQARQLTASLTYDHQAVARDLPALVSTMLATGLRIGEAAALTWTNLDFETGRITVAGTVIRLRGQGLRVKPAPKTRAGVRTVLLPRWCLAMLNERAAIRFGRPDDQIFPAPMGGLRDPSNTSADIKDAFTNAGFEWATSHVLRKTTATLLDMGGLSAREIADQLGHANPSMTHDRYMGRGVASERGASILESLGSDR
jgi:integrase